MVLEDERAGGNRGLAIQSVRVIQSLVLQLSVLFCARPMGMCAKISTTRYAHHSLRKCCRTL